MIMKEGVQGHPPLEKHMVHVFASLGKIKFFYCNKNKNEEETEMKVCGNTDKFNEI